MFGTVGGVRTRVEARPGPGCFFREIFSPGGISHDTMIWMELLISLSSPPLHHITSSANSNRDECLNKRQSSKGRTWGTTRGVAHRVSHGGRVSPSCSTVVKKMMAFWLNWSRLVLVPLLCCLFCALRFSGFLENMADVQMLCRHCHCLGPGRSHQIPFLLRLPPPQR